MSDRPNLRQFHGCETRAHKTPVSNENDTQRATQTERMMKRYLIWVSFASLLSARVGVPRESHLRAVSETKRNEPRKKTEKKKPNGSNTTRRSTIAVIPRRTADGAGLQRSVISSLFLGYDGSGHRRLFRIAVRSGHRRHERHSSAGTPPTPPRNAAIQNGGHRLSLFSFHFSSATGSLQRGLLPPLFPSLYFLLHHLPHNTHKHGHLKGFSVTGEKQRGSRTSTQSVSRGHGRSESSRVVLVVADVVPLAPGEGKKALQRSCQSVSGTRSRAAVNNVVVLVIADGMGSLSSLVFLEEASMNGPEQSPTAR